MKNYELNDLMRASKEIANIEADKEARSKEVRQDVAEFLRDPIAVAERLVWLFEGNYGYGQMIMSHNILERPRMNRPAALVQLLCVFEKLSSRENTRKAWKLLSTKEQKILQKVIEDTLIEAEKDLKQIKAEEYEREQCARTATLTRDELQKLN